MAKSKASGGSHTSLGALIKRAAGEAGMSLIELAAEVGVSRPTMYAYVGDKLPVPETRLTRIANSTGKSLEFFLDGPRGLLDRSSLTKGKLDLIDAWLSPSDPQRASQLADEVLRVVEEYEDAKAEATVLHKAGNALILKGDFASAVGKLDRARRIFEREGDSELAAAVAQSLGLAYTNLGQLEQAEECFQFSQDAAAPERRWKGSLSMAALAERKGDFSAALAILDILSSDPNASDMTHAYVLANLASCHLAQGRWSECLALMPDAYRAAVRLSLIDQQIELTLQRGQAHIWLGKWEEGSMDIAMAKAMARVHEDQGRQTLATIWEAILLARTGHVDEARTCAIQAHDLAVRHQLRRSESLALLALAEIAARRGQSEAMEDYARQAQSHADTFGYVQAQAAAAAWLSLAGHTDAAERFGQIMDTHGLVDIGWSPEIRPILSAIARKDFTELDQLLKTESQGDVPPYARLDWQVSQAGTGESGDSTDKKYELPTVIWLEAATGIVRREVCPLPLPWSQLVCEKSL